MAGESMNEPKDSIVVFDSGVGGLSVLRQLVALMPEERYLYFGDSANAPYGTRCTEEVRRLTLEAVAKLMDRPVKALVVACNTATAAAIGDLRAAYPDTIVVGIEPAVKVAADHFPGCHVGVLATPVTLREEKFAHLLDRVGAACQVEPIPAPGLVELVEAGEPAGPQALALLHTLLDPWVGRLDALVLGCTHFPFAAGAIHQVLGSGTVLLDGGAGTARETKRRLAAAGLLRPSGAGQVTLLNSSPDGRLLELSRHLLEMP